MGGHKMQKYARKARKIGRSVENDGEITGTEQGNPGPLWLFVTASEDDVVIASEPSVGGARQTVASPMRKARRAVRPGSYTGSSDYAFWHELRFVAMEFPERVSVLDRVA